MRPGIATMPVPSMTSSNPWRGGAADAGPTASMRPFATVMNPPGHTSRSSLTVTMKASLISVRAIEHPPRRSGSRSAMVVILRQEFRGVELRHVGRFREQLQPHQRPLQFGDRLIVEVAGLGEQIVVRD